MSDDDADHAMQEAEDKAKKILNAATAAAGGVSHGVVGAGNPQVIHSHPHNVPIVGPQDEDIPMKHD